jgi:hypothetical protein
MRGPMLESDLVWESVLSLITGGDRNGHAACHRDPTALEAGVRASAGLERDRCPRVVYRGGPACRRPALAWKQVGIMTPDHAPIESLRRLRGLRETGVPVADRPAPWVTDELRYAWLEAEAEAALAYADWRRVAGPTSYAVYRAAQDRADAAQDALARSVA